MTEKELTELKELLDTVTPLTWADHAGKIWNAAPALITAAEREAKLRKAAVEFLAVADVDYNNLTPDQYTAFQTRYDAAEVTLRQAL